MNATKTKEMNFEINLLPMISLLAVIIAFLLLTAVWVHIGSMDISQAMGEETNDNTVPPPTVTVDINSSGDLILKLSEVKNTQALHNVKITAVGGRINYEALKSYTEAMKEKLPEVKTALILPKANSNYEDIIKVMDQFKKSEIKDIGISPL